MTTLERRVRYAAAALTGLLANSDRDVPMSWKGTASSFYAEYAFEIADAMLKKEQRRVKS